MFTGGVSPSEWSPSYTVPGALETSEINLNKVVDIGVPGLADSDVRNGLFAEYGGGAFVEDFSEGGAFVIAGSGGHGGPAMVGAFVFDFATASWSRIDPQGGTDFYRVEHDDYTAAETSGTPYFEINDSDGIPSPGHPYHYLVPLPTALGGGPKGAVVYAMRAAVCADATGIGLRAHKFDLDAGEWSRLAVNSARTPSVATSGSAVLDVARNRIWVTEGSEGWKERQYLDLSDNEYKLMAASANFPASPIACGLVFMHEGLLLKQGGNYPDDYDADPAIYCYDPDDPTTGSGWTTLTVTGDTLPVENVIMPWTYVPETGKFYKIPYDGGTTLYELTPPESDPKTGTWTLDTLAISPGLPKSIPQPPTDPNGYFHNRLFYVPALGCLAYIPGDSTALPDQGVHLIGVA